MVNHLPEQRNYTTARFQAFECHLRANGSQSTDFFTIIFLNMNIKRIFAVASLAAIFFVGCKKDAAETTVQIRLTDGPADFTEVNIDILEVRVKTSDDTTKWLLLSTNAGIYNLLDFQNGIDTLLATGPVPASVTLKEVRFVLGPNNSVKLLDDGSVHPLEAPSAEDSGLKVKLDKTLGTTIDTFILDFDAAESIKLSGSDYKLKPVIKLK